MILRALLLLAALSAVAASAADSAAIEARGRQIFHEGSSPTGAPIAAFLGVDQTELPASAVPCASCHGSNGRGRPEGGVVPSDITWSELSKGYGHEHDYGRRHPAYDEASTAAAIATGLDPAGNRMDVVMPRYRMQREDMDALIAYLKRIEFEFDRGISAQSVRVATLLPLSGPAAERGAAMRAALTAFVNQVNAGGGINGRVLDLQVIALGSSPEQTVANVGDALRTSEIFALVSIFDQDVVAELAALFDADEIPVVGAVAPPPDDENARARQTFYVYAGNAELMLSLSEFAVSQAGSEVRRQVLVGPDNELLSTLARSVWSGSGAVAEKLPYAATTFDAAAMVAKLHASDDVLFLGAGPDMEALLQALEAAQKVPRLFLPAAALTPAVLQAPAIFNERIFVAYPTLPADISDDGREFYTSLGAYGTLPATHFASQVGALAAARVLVEAMRRAGRALSHESFVAELERMHEFATGLAPPVSFSLNRRIGASGAHIVKVDLDTGRLVPAAEWRDLR